MTQTIPDCRPGRRSNDYQQLMRERALIGAVLVDLLSHQSMANAVEVFRRVQRVDRMLERFRRYGNDRRVVEAIEDLRWHTPPQPPAGGLGCSLCTKQRLELPADLPLPFVMRRSA